MYNVKIRETTTLNAIQVKSLNKDNLNDRRVTNEHKLALRNNLNNYSESLILSHLDP